MPRKVNYGAHYDEDYDDWDGYDHESDIEEDGHVIKADHAISKTKHAVTKAGLWRCPICTFDNESCEVACEICGVFRYPAVDICSKDDEDTGKLEKLTSSTVSLNIAAKKGKSKMLSNTKDARTSFHLQEVGQPRVKESNNSLVMGQSQTSRSHFKKTNVDEDFESLKRHVNSRKSKLSPQRLRETWTPPDEVGALTQLNLAIVGHVDSGKSTLSGRLLSLLGQISQKDMHKYEKEAKLIGKGSFAYAWAMDESVEERERGITMTVAIAYFYSKKYHVVLLDSPGHKDFVPNLISGATQADAAILVIDASVGSFEAGMDVNGGQTREHAQLIRSFGIDQIIVAINKMDVVEYSKERFDSIKLHLGTFLRSRGFKDSLLSWVPLSAIENQNLVTAASDPRLSSWYHGPHLLAMIDSLESPPRDTSKPLLMPICDVIKSHSLGQAAASGKLEYGTIQCGLKVLIMPSKELAVIRSIERGSKACNVATAGDSVAVGLQGIDSTHVMAGGVLCHQDFPVMVANHLELKVIMLDGAMPIVIGSQVEFHVHHAKEAAKVAKILCLFDLKTGQVSKRGPRCLTAKQNALVEVILDKGVCVEEFSKCRVLGRVFLRALGRTIAVGIVTRIIG
ncbi:hypothetical protein Syun_021822 [Stephania yunnanensis]|uniref:Uncharacterized protein n=1 Tax=Stephania yunnanensis TaxID=152371 RepID=A0AAP0IGS7_9MAGN